MVEEKRAWAAILACILAAVMLFSVSFIALEADHDCAGEDCVICAVLSVCEDALHLLVGPGSGMSLTLLIVSTAAFIRFEEHSILCCPTPVTLKTKLSD